MRNGCQVWAIRFKNQMLTVYFRKNLIQTSVLKSCNPTNTQIKTHGNNFLCLLKISAETMKDASKLAIQFGLQELNGFINRFARMNHYWKIILFCPVYLDAKCFLLLFP